MNLTLRILEPVDSIFTGLERYVPDYIRQENIPGIAIAMHFCSVLTKINYIFTI